MEKKRMKRNEKKKRETTLGIAIVYLYYLFMMHEGGGEASPSCLSQSYNMQKIKQNKLFLKELPYFYKKKRAQFSQLLRFFLFFYHQNPKVRIHVLPTLHGYYILIFIMPFNRNTSHFCIYIICLSHLLFYSCCASPRLRFGLGSRGS